MKCLTAELRQYSEKSLNVEGLHEFDVYAGRFVRRIKGEAGRGRMNYVEVPVRCVRVPDLKIPKSEFHVLE